MLARCRSHGHEIIRYDEPYNLPCEECGDPELWIQHFGLPFPHNIPPHEFLKNVVTGEVIIPDPYEDYFKDK